MIIDSRQFRLVISITDLFQWSDDDTPFLLGTWAQMIELLGLDESEIAALYDLYFESTSIGQGDVYAFISHAEPENRLLFDLYRGLTDQLDIIEIMVSASRELVIPAKFLIRQAFDLASHTLRRGKFSASLQGCYRCGRLPKNDRRKQLLPTATDHILLTIFGAYQLPIESTKRHRQLWVESRPSRAVTIRKKLDIRNEMLRMIFEFNQKAPLSDGPEGHRSTNSPMPSRTQSGAYQKICAIFSPRTPRVVDKPKSLISVENIKLKR